MNSDQLDRKLEEARKKAREYGDLRGRKETADDYVKGVYATLYAGAPGETVSDRDTWVKRQQKYRDAIEEKQNRYADWTTAELYMKLLFAQAEKYRTDEATNRGMDRAHR